MSTTIETPDFAPPMPTETPPKNRQWSFVPAHMKGGKLHKAHWRLAPLKREPKPRKDMSWLGPKKRGPKPDQPRFTTEAHARHLYDRLDLPLMMIYALLHNSQQRDPEWEQVLRACGGAILDARTFINRFTNPQDDA